MDYENQNDCLWLIAEILTGASYCIAEGQDSPSHRDLENARRVADQCDSALLKHGIAVYALTPTADIKLPIEGREMMGKPELVIRWNGGEHPLDKDTPFGYSAAFMPDDWPRSDLNARLRIALSKV